MVTQDDYINHMVTKPRVNRLKSEANSEGEGGGGASPGKI